MGNVTPRLRSVFADAYDKIRKGELQTLIPFLCMFKVNGTPMNLNLHYQFAPMFATKQPVQTCWMFGRQEGKSFQLSADTHMRASLIPNYHTLIVQPRADQIQRFNGTVFQPLMRSCPLQSSFISSLELSKLALKTYSNGSLVYLDHVFSNPDRIRGCSGLSAVRVDESLTGDTEVLVKEHVEKEWVKCKVSDIRKGMLARSFSDDCTVCSVTAKDASFHGIRGVYKVCTATGRQLECTLDHSLRTAGGRQRLSEIIADIYGRTVDAAHMPDSRCTDNSAALIRVRYSDSADKEELHIRGLLDSISAFNKVHKDEESVFRAVSIVVYESTDDAGGCLLHDPIASIEYTGEQPVYDIEVVGTHNYILANGICSYNCQDVEYEYIPIILEVMSASLNWYFSCYTGTPKTTDTTLGLLWNQSSQAEWVVPCKHCGHMNVPNPDHDLIKMLGKTGIICAKCGGGIDPINGGYVHAYPDRAMVFPGYHIAQAIHPLHLSNINKWNNLLAKVDTYDQLTLYNEIFGWPYDASTSPLMLADLKKAEHSLPKIEYPEDIEKIADQYCYITVGVDWGGGGAISDSYTAYAVIGRRANSDVVDVIYGKRIPKGMSPTDEANEILRWIRGSGADAFAFDNGGAGFARLEIMKHQGLMSIPNLIVVPITYTRPGSGDVIKLHKAERETDLYYYTLDKSRSLAINIMAIKAGRIRIPPFDETDEKAYQRDFLALREDPQKSRSNDTVILIIKKPGVPDDFAHAVNFGCSQIWDHFGAYPRIGSRYDTTILDMDEHNKPIMDPDVFGPRSDFERFRGALDTEINVFNTGDLYD